MIRGQTPWQRQKKHGALLPMGGSDRRILLTHRIHIEQDQSFLEPDATSEITSFWRSVGVAAAMLLAIVLLITLMGVLQHD